MRKSEELLKKVQKDYTALAKDFDATRKAAWAEFTYLEKVLQPFLKGKSARKLRLLDAGCGNGRLALFLKNMPIDYYGIDNNKALLALASKKLGKRAHLRFGTIQKLPYRRYFFDAVCCIAALHHLPDQQLQLQALEEMRRVLKKNRILFITCWNLWQATYKSFIDRTTHHAFIPWSDSKIKRFYYAFTRQELRRRIVSAGFTNITPLKSAHNFTFICYA